MCVLYRKVTLDSKDANLRRSSLALLGMSLAERGIAHGDLIVSAFEAAEQKQIHLIEPVSPTDDRFSTPSLQSALPQR